VSTLSANCPSCAGPLEFKSGSTIVVVCPFCRSAVARTDRGLDDLGKIAEIAESESPLRLGLKGTWRDTRFELTGRARNRHQLGGVWDEWYATFSNGWVGWLAEAQGRFYLTFHHPLPGGTVLPEFNSLQLGQAVHEIPSETPLMVYERGIAEPVGADGEIPYKLIPGERFEYADLSGKGDAFATIDYSEDPPWVFVGKQVTLAEIGLAEARPAERESRRVNAAAMGCPNCGGPLDLVAPDKTERVTCPNCDSLLDVNQGNLSYLKALAETDAPAFTLSVGAEGTFDDGTKYKIIGAMARSVVIDEIKYFWHEYLLYNAAVGFRWLVHSDNHWNFVTPVNAADVTAPNHIGSGAVAHYDGKAFKIFQDAAAVVEYVKGEFYWRVEQGETVRAVDFVAAPLMLSQEATADEINWSLGKYITNAEVEKAFSVPDLPIPWDVAPNQPFTGNFYYTWGLLPVAGLFLIALLMIPFTGATVIAHRETLTLSPQAPGVPVVAFSGPFNLKGNRNVEITATAPVSNSGAYLDVDLINEQSQEVESVEIPVSYFQGVEGGESWSEGSPSNSAAMSSLPAGKYTLRVEGELENVTGPLPVEVKVEQGVARGINFLCALIVLAIVPILGLIRKISFESSRWKNSMFSSTSSE
jgi:uncharacterized Zn finger protein (UPF0148 family)